MAYYKEIDDMLTRRGKAGSSGGSSCGGGAGKIPKSNSKIDYKGAPLFTAAMFCLMILCTVKIDHKIKIYRDSFVRLKIKCHQ
jgi:hypothetical protein